MQPPIRKAAGQTICHYGGTWIAILKCVSAGWDLLDSGGTLSGGLAQLPCLAEHPNREFGLDVRVASDPTLAAALGAGHFLEQESVSGYDVVASHEDLKGVEEQIELIGARLSLDRKWLARRFEEAKYEPKYLPVAEVRTTTD